MEMIDSDEFKVRWGTVKVLILEGSLRCDLWWSHLVELWCKGITGKETLVFSADYLKENFSYELHSDKDWVKTNRKEI